MDKNFKNIICSNANGVLGITSACSTPGFPVLPNLPEFAQVHVL